MMTVFKHFLQKKITKMKRYRNLALVNFLHYGKMNKLLSLMNSNQLFFHRINFVRFGLQNEESFGFQTCGREGMTRNILQHQWKDEFRMSRKTFESIIEIVRPSLQKQNTQLRTVILIEKKGCCSYLAIYIAILHSCRENVRNRKINSRFYHT